jgi:hypothetical protein
MAGEPKPKQPCAGSSEAEFVLRDAIASRARRQHFPFDGRCPRVAFLERLRAPEIPKVPTITFA